MQNLRSLRQRIRSVQNTQKITRAMQMVAGAKLRRSQEELVVFRPYADRLETMTQRFLAAHPYLEHPLFKNVSAEAPAGLILITSDTGLCGTYNERVMAMAGRFMQEHPSVQVVTIGKKGTRFLARRSAPRLREVLDWGGRFEPEPVRLFVDWLQTLFLEGKVSSWMVAYTQFLSALSWKPVTAQLFPVDRPAREEVPEKLIVEPETPLLAEKLLNRAVAARFSRILLEAFTAEHSARMIAMKNATENASDMISTLTLVRNKARQAAITKELIEVISGAKALQ